ncbi:hypothetical protein [Borrelia turicatae]
MIDKIKDSQTDGVVVGNDNYAGQLAIGAANVNSVKGSTNVAEQCYCY